MNSYRRRIHKHKIYAYMRTQHTVFVLLYEYDVFKLQRISTKFRAEYFVLNRAQENDGIYIYIYIYNINFDTRIDVFFFRFFLETLNEHIIQISSVSYKHLFKTRDFLVNRPWSLLKN
jgi:hypothetical protein